MTQTSLSYITWDQFEEIKTRIDFNIYVFGECQRKAEGLVPFQAARLESIVKTQFNKRLYHRLCKNKALPMDEPERRIRNNHLARKVNVEPYCQALAEVLATQELANERASRGVAPDRKNKRLKRVLYNGIKDIVSSQFHVTR